MLRNAMDLTAEGRVRMRFVLVVLVAAMAPPASAALLRVPDDFATIGDALGVSSSGDTVEVACGIYHEHDLVLVSGVRLVSETRSASCVTIDADDIGRLIRCHGTETSVIEGFTFTGGKAQGIGGGLDAAGGALVIRRCD